MIHTTTNLVPFNIGGYFKKVISLLLGFSSACTNIDFFATCTDLENNFGAFIHPDIHPNVRTFGYNIAVTRTRSLFGGVQEGTQFAASEHR